ncbi:shikimate kinase [Caminibacter sp.]
MQVNNSMRPDQLIQAIQVDMIKKSQDVTKNIIGKILQDNFENTMKIQQEAAKATGVGMNLNIKG